MLTPYTTDLVVKILIFAVFALSLELLVGMTGLVSLGHAAFFGLGAYVTVLLSPEADPGNVALLAGAAMAVAALYALFVGALSLRTKGVYFIMVTLAFAQMAYFVFHDTQLGGGSDGIYLNVRPVLGAARRRRQAALLLPGAGGAGGHLRRPGAAAAHPLRPCAGGHPRQRAAHARRRLHHLPATSWRPSCWPARWRAWRASCWR